MKQTDPNPLTPELEAQVQQFTRLLAAALRRILAEQTDPRTLTEMEPDDDQPQSPHHPR